MWKGGVQEETAEMKNLDMANKKNEEFEATKNRWKPRDRLLCFQEKLEMNGAELGIHLRKKLERNGADLGIHQQE